MIRGKESLVAGIIGLGSFFLPGTIQARGCDGPCTPEERAKLGYEQIIVSRQDYTLSYWRSIEGIHGDTTVDILNKTRDYFLWIDLGYNLKGFDEAIKDLKEIQDCEIPPIRNNHDGMYYYFPVGAAVNEVYTAVLDDRCLPVS